jgi:hypothetical protein
LTGLKFYIFLILKNLNVLDPYIVKIFREKTALQKGPSLWEGPLIFVYLSSELETQAEANHSRIQNFIGLT